MGSDPWWTASAACSPFRTAPEPCWPRAATTGDWWSSSTYCLAAGLIPGAFVEANTARQLPQTLVHELGHVIDGTVISDSYTRGAFRYPYRSMPLSAQKGERDRHFARSTPEPLGFVSSYARSNAQEDFAETCVRFIENRAEALAQGRREQELGSRRLQD
jgi:hypothetical protein